MNTYTLKMFNTGQITLPKSWRQRQKTQHFLAEETEKGLLIKPLITHQEVVEYNDKKSFGLVFPNGINAEDFLNILEQSVNEEKNG